MDNFGNTDGKRSGGTEVRWKSDGALFTQSWVIRRNIPNAVLLRFTGTYILMGVQHYKLEKRNKGGIGIRKETEPEVENVLECKNYE